MTFPSELRLALRNIMRSKKNSFVIILLIGSITALFFIGNSVAGNGSRGLKRSFVDNITGDILIEEKGDITMNLFGANTPVLEERFVVPVLSAHSAIVEYLALQPEAAQITSQVSGRAAMEALGLREAVLLCGIDGDNYFDAFPGITLAEGRFLRRGEFGAMVTEEKARSLETRSGHKLNIGETITFSAAGESGFKIREAPLVGIFRYDNPSNYLNEVILADVQTVRILQAISIATSDVKVEEDALSLLGQGSALEDLFSKGGNIDGAANENSANTAGSLVDDLFDFLGGENEGNTGGAGSGANGMDAEGGDWNFIVLRLVPGASADRFIAKHKDVLGGFGAMAVGWRLAAGTSAILAFIVQILFNGGILMVSAACILAVVNILLIAVFKRTREIGTLRAIGARDAYIRALVFTENCVLGFIAGLCGVLLGAAALSIVNRAGIHISNDILASILGGDIVNIAVTPALAFLSVLAAIIISVLSSIYPVETAVKINPIVAVQTG